VSGLVRVSLDVSAVPAHPGGAGRYTIDLAHALGRRTDVALTLWARRGDSGRWAGAIGSDHPATVRATVPDRRPGRLLWEQARLPGLLARTPVDVHHGPHYTMPERVALPVVVTIHDMTFFDHPEWHQRSKAPVFRRAIRVAARRAAALVCVSRPTAERLEELVAPRARVFVVPHGVDAERFRPDERAPGADDGVLRALGMRRPYVLFVGTLEPRKAVPELVSAFDALAATRPELRLVLVGGRGWGSAALEAALAGSRHRDRIDQPGYVSDDSLPALLRRADVVVYPARQEGFGLPALEALACGAPLVTTTGTVMADMAGGAAWTVTPGSVDELRDAIAAVVDGGVDPDRRRVGFEVAAGHTWAAAAAGHVAAYRWAVHGDEGGSGPDGRQADGDADGTTQTGGEGGTTEPGDTGGTTEPGEVGRQDR
jgi:glycosyltransferase involved in cell wall biosynthesis